MKTMTMIIALVSVILCVSSQAPFSCAAEAPNPVLDTAGKKVRANTWYYIIPAHPTDGGVQLESLNPGKPCPPDIVLEDAPVPLPGLPVSFVPINDKKGVVRVSTDLNIRTFQAEAAPTKCPGSSNWWSLDTGNSLLTTGGRQGNPGPETIINWFKIQALGRGEYKLVYCPKFCSSCQVPCKNVGVVFQNGKKRLSLTHVPIKFALKMRVVQD